MKPRPDPIPRRHDLVWLDAMPSLSKAGDAAAQWFARGLPVVVARRDGALRADELSLGIALPPAQRRQRIALTAPIATVRAIAPPLRLTQVMDSAPKRWRTPLCELAESGMAAGIEFRVYGSFAWQHLTGQRYVHAASDIDLLWSPEDRGQLERGLMLLPAWERDTGLETDGEIVLSDGAAIAWREVLNPQRRVLVKYPTSIALRDKNALLESLIRAP
ncbi:MAG: malonate decarboxylase holo-[acyl-carrier-protein] synthase [Burkholderiales bacterium]